MNKQQQSEFETIHIFPAILFILICIASVYGLLILPIPRQIGLTFRNTLYVFPVILAAAWACCEAKNRYIRVIFMCLLFAFVLLPYSGMINSGMSDQYALGGFVPWSDAFTMQLNTQRFLYGGMMGQSSALRPLSLIFYGAFLHCFDNNYFALQIFLCVVTALCLIFTMEAVKDCFGSVCGAFFYTILYYYIRQRLGTYMTEPYGFICGLLCCRWLLNGVRKRQNISILAGILFLSIGLNARPAAMFLFPAIGLWYFFVYLRGNSRRLVWAAAAFLIMLSGFLMNHFAQRGVYGDEKLPNRQAAEMVYGLCLGGRLWGDVVSTPEMIALNDSDDVFRDVASLCKPILEEHPENIFFALKTIFYDSLIRSQYYGAFSFVNGNPRQFQTAFRYLLMAVWTAGIIILWRRKKEPVRSVLLIAAGGILLSECAAVPFSSNYLRLYAVSMWIPACICGVFPQYLYESLRKTRSAPKADPIGPGREIISVSLGTLIMITAVFGAMFIRKHPLYRPAALFGVCRADEDVLVTSVDEGSFIYLDEYPSLAAEHYPYFRLPYVRQHFHDTASMEMFPFTDAISSPTAVIRGMDLTNEKDALIFAPLDLVQGKTGYAQFCGNFIDPPILRNDRFFVPTTVTFYENGL